MLTIEKEKTKYQPRWNLVDDTGRVIWRITPEGYQVPVCGKTKDQVLRWVLGRFEQYMRCANSGIFPSTISEGLDQLPKPESSENKYAEEQRGEGGE